MLVVWLADNDTTDWTVGIKFEQFQKNLAHHSGINCSPYSAMFGCEAKIGLTFSALHTEVIATMQNEDDLVAALTSSSSQNSTAEAATDDSTDDSTVLIPVPLTSSADPDGDDDEAAQQTLAYRTTQIRKRRAAAYSGQVAQQA